MPPQRVLNMVPLIEFVQSMLGRIHTHTITSMKDILNSVHTNIAYGNMRYHAVIVEQSHPQEITATDISVMRLDVEWLIAINAICNALYNLKIFKLWQFLLDCKIC